MISRDFHPRRARIAARRGSLQLLLNDLLQSAWLGHAQQLSLRPPSGWQDAYDCSVIALWLGHEHVETTLIYLEATLAMKEKALAKTSPPDGRPGRYKPGDRLLAFLNSL